MKNNKVLFILSCVFFAICFIINWFKHDIYDRIFIIIVIIYFVLLILYIILLIISIKNIKTNESIFPTLSIIILIITAFIPFKDFSLNKAKLEVNLYMSKRLEIIELIKQDKLDYYYKKNIKLPKYKYISSDGEVYVYQNDKDQVICFWLSRGAVDVGSTEIIYSTGGEKLIRKNVKVHPITKIIKLKKDWYYVETDY